MTRIDSTKLKWRVQFRIVRDGKWRNAGLFEARSMARAQAEDYRFAYGFGNTRVVRHISEKGRACS